jgi:hypothetical protein
MATQGVGTFALNSFWESGSLIFYEKAYGHTTTGNVFTLGASAVKVGDTANDVDFQYYGTGSLSAIIDCGAATFTLVGIATSTNGAVTITNATTTSSTTTGALIVTGGIATAADITCGDDLFMSNGGVINFNAGNVTITHSAGALACTGALTISTGTESTSTTTGTLIVTGGIGFSGDMYVGDDIFMAATGVINFGAGDITITGGTNTLAIAGASVGVTADGPISVTIAALTAGDAYSGIKSSVTCAAPSNAIGAAGYVEATYTGTGAGHFYAFGSWINFGASAVTGAYHVCAQDNGVYGTVTATNTRLIFGLKMEAIITGTPEALCPFYLGTSNKAITALFDIASGPAIGAASASSGTITGKVPLYVDAAGTVKYVAVYDSLT